LLGTPPWQEADARNCHRSHADIAHLDTQAPLLVSGEKCPLRDDANLDPISLKSGPGIDDAKNGSQQSQSESPVLQPNRHIDTPPSTLAQSGLVRGAA